MKDKRAVLFDALFTLGILAVTFTINLICYNLFDAHIQTPIVFVLGVFLIALRTQHFIWSILASIISTLIVNYFFADPIGGFDFISSSMLVSSVMIGFVAILIALITLLCKRHVNLMIESEREHMHANLLRAVSHDLRTPLTTIYGSCSAIIENYDYLDKEQRIKLLGEMQEDSIWLIRMVENLLSVTKIQGSNVEITKTPTVLDELLDATLLKFRKYYPDQEIALSIPDDFVSIPMDAFLIKQVLINLLENAVHHADGMTTLTLSVTLSDNKATFTVSDDGCGIPSSQLQKLFTGYLDRKQLSADSTRRSMGIGLSVCSSIVSAHGSRLYAENNDLGGASFYFTLETEAV